MNILSRLELHPRSPTYVMFLICLNPLPQKKETKHNYHSLELKMQNTNNTSRAIEYPFNAYKYL